MILENQEIFDIIQKRADKDELAKAVTEYHEYNALINGVNFLKYLDRLEYYEKTPDQWEARKACAISTKSLVSLTLRPEDKIFSARGGSKYYNLPKEKKQDFLKKLSNISDGVSVKKWFENIFKNKLHVDPNGVIMHEISKDGESIKPCYVSVENIYTRKNIGQELEYICFNPIKDKETNALYYRFIDDLRDVYVKVKDENYSIPDGTFTINGKEYASTITNIFGRVPAYVISDTKDSTYNIQQSPVADIKELLNIYLVDNSIYRISKRRHGFPVPVMVEQDCKTCGGTGMVESKQCPSCLGTRKERAVDVTDGFLVKEDELANGTRRSVTDVLTWATPPLESLEANRVDLEEQQKHIMRVMWGEIREDTTAQATATEIVMSKQTQTDRLNSISKTIEKSEQKTTDFLGKFYYAKEYKGSSINYGQIYIYEPAGAILERFTKNKQDGMPEYVLDKTWRDYLYSEYENDPIELERQLKIYTITPYPFNTAEDLKQIGIEGRDLMYKAWFADWLNSVSKDDKTFKTEEKLKSDYDNYFNTKYLEYEKQRSKTVSTNESDPQF